MVTPRLGQMVHTSAHGAAHAGSRNNHYVTTIVSMYSDSIPPGAGRLAALPAAGLEVPGCGGTVPVSLGLAGPPGHGAMEPQSGTAASDRDHDGHGAVSHGHCR
jgi:hypothetical protein